MRVFAAIFVLVSLLCPCLAEESSKDSREQNLETVKKTLEKRLNTYAGNPDIMVRRGLLADRKKKRVEIQAEATGVGERETIEFFLITEKSGKDYEALAIAFATAEDVRAALEFIGMTPGRPVAFDRVQFWPKGERVFMTIDGVAVEDMVMDRRTNKPLPRSGLVFTGGNMLTSTSTPPQKVHAGDLRSPFAIAANYNEIDVVLDIPRAAPQGAVYEQQALNPKQFLPEFKPVTVVLEPEHKDGTPRVMDVTLDVDVAPVGTNTPAADEGNKAQQALAGLRFEVRGQGDAVLNEDPTVNGMLGAFIKLVEGGKDPFVSLRLAEATPVGAAHVLAQVLSSIESEKGIRMEPPPRGQLYYKAFLPAEKDRERKGRMMQPWELRLRVSDGKVSGMLTYIKEIWKQDKLEPDLVPKDYPIATPGELREHLNRALRQEFKAAIAPIADEPVRKSLSDKLSQTDVNALWGEEGEALRVGIFDAYDNNFAQHKIYKLRAVLVYVPASLTHGQMMSFVSPILGTHPQIHVFIED